MSANWTDAEIRQLLSLRAEDKILSKIKGTVRDGVVYQNMAATLQKRGVHWRKPQIISKLKNLRKTYLTIKERYGNRGTLHWPYFDLCESIWGSGCPSKTESEDGKDVSNVDPEDGITSEEETMDIVVKEEQEESRPEFPSTPPPKKRPRVKVRHLQPSEALRRLLTNMERDYNERESVRIKEQREYEDMLRKEAREYETQERSMQMAMWKDMQETQNKFFKGFLCHMALFTQPPPPPTPPPPPQQELYTALGELGKGAGKGGGGGGSVREAGGAFGKRQAAEEEMYFRKKEKDQIAALRQHHQEEISHHQKEIDRLKDEISRHEGKIKQLKKHD